MSDSGGFNADNGSLPSATNAGLSSSVTGEITVAAVILIFVLFAATLILYLRAKGYSGTIGAISRSTSRHLSFAPPRPNIAKQALDPSILSSLPVIVFQAEDFKESCALECAVCLSELKDGDSIRLLPKCKHGFHVECIDMWFHSNSTCPLCRNPVQADVDSPQTPSKISLDEGSSSTDKRQRLVIAIEIPRSAAEGFSLSPNTSLTSSRMPGEGAKSPALERLRRILGRGSNLVGSSCSPRGNYDIEQGTPSATVLQKSSESTSCS